MTKRRLNRCRDFLAHHHKAVSRGWFAFGCLSREPQPLGYADRSPKQLLSNCWSFSSAPRAEADLLKSRNSSLGAAQTLALAMNFSSSFQMIPHSRTITGHVLCEPVSLRAIASASLVRVPHTINASLPCHGLILLALQSCVQGDIAAWFAKLLKPPSVQADWALQPDALLLHPIHLPSELLISVVEPLQHSKRDLSALMFCCRQLYWIARPFFYRTLYTPRRYALSGLTRLTAWLKYQPDLLAALQHLDFDWEQPDSMVWMLVQNAVALKRLREDVLPNTHHLRTLVIPESMLHTRTIWLLEGLPRSVDRLALTRPGGTDDSLWFADAVLRAFKLLDSAVEENPEYELSGRTHLFMNTHSLLCFPQALRILRRSTNVTRVAFGCAEFGACAKHLHRLVECGLAFESLTVNCLSLWLLSTSSLPLAFENLHTLHVVPKSPPSSPDDFVRAVSRDLATCPFNTIPLACRVVCS